jgi:hypothetical protein
VSYQHASQAKLFWPQLRIFSGLQEVFFSTEEWAPPLSFTGRLGFHCGWIFSFLLQQSAGFFNDFFHARLFWFFGPCRKHTLRRPNLSPVLPQKILSGLTTGT